MPALNAMVNYFEVRKQDHIRLSLDPAVQAKGMSGLDRISLTHEALPEMDLDEVRLDTQIFKGNLKLKAPVFVSSMTAGHGEALRINRNLLEACSQNGWLMGVGSQRRELFDPEVAKSEWRLIRKDFPDSLLFGNIGLAQLIKDGPDVLKVLFEILEPRAFFVHLNPLQECLQPEGTPFFKNGLKTIEAAVKISPVPIVIKEVGCGLSSATLNRLRDSGIAAADVSGLGGTHWGRIENMRTPEGHELYHVGRRFNDWGIATVEALEAAMAVKAPFDIWASGGVRSGVDVVKLLAMGASLVGMAQPFLTAALTSAEAVSQLISQIERELKIAMFCCGIKTISDFRERKVWQWRKI